MPGENPSHKPPSSLRNPISFLGIIIALLATAFGLPLMFMDMLSRHTPPYLGVIIYLILPFVAGGGIILSLLGVWWERRRRKQRPGVSLSPLPRIDLNRRRDQMAVIAVFTLIMTIVVLLSITGYRTYHFTDSTEFCGVVCHQVMKPEFTAYQHSPHARVTCTQCHIGPGAKWFVRSKLSGAYQVYATMAKKYPKPIQVPVKNLRPAQETCEQCHWPQKFFGAKQKTFNHYLADEQNSPWQIQMLTKIGGGDPKTGSPSGIHWHMNIKNDIEYIANDEQRQVISWVRATDPDGNVAEYMSTEAPLTPEQMAKAQVRRMDCVDCHNRPSHIFHPPDRAVEEAFFTGRLDPTLPYLKREAIRLLAAEYTSEKEASDAILMGLDEFYKKEYPQIHQEKALSIQQATTELQEIYKRNFFPEMKANWKVYPNHIGHLNSQGCFRCHDGLHQSREGKVITKDCNVCHTILAQGPPEEIAGAKLESQPFQHPVDVGADVTEYKCSDCHTGTGGL